MGHRRPCFLFPFRCVPPRPLVWPRPPDFDNTAHNGHIFCRNCPFDSEEYIQLWHRVANFLIVKTTSCLVRCFGLWKQQDIGTSSSWGFYVSCLLLRDFESSYLGQQGFEYHGRISKCFSAKTPRIEMHVWIIWDLNSLATSVNSQVAANCRRREWYDFMNLPEFRLPKREDLKFHILFRFKVRVQLRFNCLDIFSRVQQSVKGLRYIACLV